MHRSYRAEYFDDSERRIGNIMKAVVVVYFKVLLQQLIGGAEENCDEP
jgi:hypothetical protein